MESFNIKAKDTKGEDVKLTIQAEDRTSAIKMCKKEGLLVLEIEEKKPVVKIKQIKPKVKWAAHPLQSK